MPRRHASKHYPIIQKIKFIPFNMIIEFKLFEEFVFTNLWWALEAASAAVGIFAVGNLCGVPPHADRKKNTEINFKIVYFFICSIDILYKSLHFCLPSSFLSVMASERVFFPRCIFRRFFLLIFS